MDLSSMVPEVLELIASLVTSLVALLSACAWPATLMVLALILRNPILKILPNLTRMKAGGFEFEFSRRIQELERKADDADIPAIEQVLQDPLDRQVSRLYLLAETSPRTAILESWLLVESATSEAALHLGIDMPDSKFRTPYAYLKHLSKRAGFPSELFSIVNELRQLRNRAVHEPEFELALSETLEFIDLAVRVANELRGRSGVLD